MQLSYMLKVALCSAAFAVLSGLALPMISYVYSGENSADVGFSLWVLLLQSVIQVLHWISVVISGMSFAGACYVRQIHRQSLGTSSRSQDASCPEDDR